jgi:hypothetical protein
MVRDTCGAVAGALAHQAAGEPVCGWCSYAEQARRIAAEGIPSRLAPPSETDVRPVSAADAALHTAVLRREVLAFDREHAGWDWRAEALRDAAGSAA